jgi:phosphoglycerol transferase MdoB-like AlkP superfamily enzyme
MKGELPILETVMYTDYALKLFFERASKTSWYNNTLFVITSDHTAQSLKDSYGNNVGMYKIPMILFKPDADTSFISNHIFQQIDLVPTIIDYLQLNDKSFGFGKSVYQTEHGYHIAYRNGAYQLLKDNYLLVLTGDKFEVYDVKNDPMLTQNIEAKSKANDTVGKNKKFLKE